MDNFIKQPAKLDYADKAMAPPWHRSRRARRGLFIFFGIAAVLCIAQWGLRAVEHVSYLHAQRLLMDHIEPEDRVVSSNDPNDVKRLSGRQDYFTWSGYRGSGNAVQFDFDISPLYQGQSQIVFARMRRAAGGPERVVVCGVRDLDFDAQAYSLATWSLGSRMSWAGRMGFSRMGTSVDAYNRTVRVLAGQPDARDESHFTVDYEVDRVRNTLDGWLMPDDSVKLESRNEPLRSK